MADLADGGAAHIKQKAPSILVEALTPDFASKGPEAVHRVATSGLDVFAHNIETVERCTPFVRDRRAGFEQSLKVLEEAKKGAKLGQKEILTKTSIMLGVGEVEEEVLETLQSRSLCKRLVARLPSLVELRQADVDVVTFGQYMRPTKKHMKVDRYVLPEEFDRWKQVAERMGFLYVASGPLVRSSYKVGGYKVKHLLIPGF